MSPSSSMFYERSYDIASGHAREIVNSPRGVPRGDAWLCFGNHRRNLSLHASHPAPLRVSAAAFGTEELCNACRGTADHWTRPPGSECGIPSQFLARRVWLREYQSLFPSSLGRRQRRRARAGSRRGFCSSRRVCLHFIRNLIFRYRALVFVILRWNSLRDEYYFSLSRSIFARNVYVS